MKLKIKIAVAASPDGQWVAYGFPSATSWDDAMDAFERFDNEQRFWVEAEIEVAEQPTTVAGTVAAA